MKQYVCVKEYVTSEGDVAFKKGKIYEVSKNGMIPSELNDIKYYLDKKFKKAYFKKHKPVKSFGGKGLYNISQSNSRVNGMRTGIIIAPNPLTNGVWVDEFTRFTQKDSIVESVVKKFKDRSDVGIKKYGTTLDRKDVDFDGWAEHLQQELMDGILYLERLRNEATT